MTHQRPRRLIHLAAFRIITRKACMVATMMVAPLLSVAGLEVERLVTSITLVGPEVASDSLAIRMVGVIHARIVWSRMAWKA